VPADWTALTRAPGPARSRSINGENPTGAPGAAGTASSQLGPGRKGRPWVPVPAGATLLLADIEGPGVIRHLWFTVTDRTDAGPTVLRDLVLRITWDEQTAPSVEVPLGDFFCNGFGVRAPITSEPISVGSQGGMNSWFRMPFRSRARIEIVSDHPVDIAELYFQIDYSVGDELPDDTARFHAQWRRSNASTALGEDHVLVDIPDGAGHYVGSYIALTSLEREWWGEGETKFFIDGDTDLPSQTSTGLEDYVGGAWAFLTERTDGPGLVPVTFSAAYCGYPYASPVEGTADAARRYGMPESHGMYRWHLPDPVIFTERLRVTLQQIGAAPGRGLFERSDDVSTVAYWYQTGPTTPFPPLPDREGRRPR
jgi:hypothetical protein